MAPVALVSPSALWSLEGYLDEQIDALCFSIKKEAQDTHRRQVRCCIPFPIWDYYERLRYEACSHFKPANQPPCMMGSDRTRRIEQRSCKFVPSRCHLVAGGRHWQVCWCMTFLPSPVHPVHNSSDAVTSFLELCCVVLRCAVLCCVVCMCLVFVQLGEFSRRATASTMTQARVGRPEETGTPRADACCRVEMSLSLSSRKTAGGHSGGSHWPDLVHQSRVSQF